MKRFLLFIATATAIAANAQVYKDRTASPRERAESIVKEMTLDEKISLMRYESPAIPRLGIEQYNWWNEALHGVSRAGIATVFPQPIGMAATFDDKLVYDVFTVVSDEARAKHHKAKKEGPLKIYQGLTFWTPNVNIYRDPRWGRGHETYGEDPYLTSKMGVSVVRGLQGDYYEGGAFTGKNPLKHYKTNACAKHYAVHSGPEWSRHTYNAKDISDRDLRETYLPAFQALVQKGNVMEVMCAYNRYEGDPCCGSNTLLQKILRNEWGYQGIVVSDCWAVDDFYFEDRHNTEPDKEHAVAKAVRAGTDLECGQAFGALAEAVRQGLVTEAEIDRAVIRLMTARYALGEMDPDSTVEWAKIPYSVVDCQAHKDLALDVARKSLVLLKNDGVLPLRKDIKIGIIGPNANDSVMQWGNYNGFPSHTSTLLSAIRERLPQSQVVYVPGFDHTSSVRLESLLEYTSASGKKGFDAKFWKKFTRNPDETPCDITYHYSTPLTLTTAGATVWAPEVPLGGFLAEFSTTFAPVKTEDVTFAVQAQGFLELFVNGERVFNGANMKANQAYTFKAEAGKEYDIKLRFNASEGECASLNFDFGRTIPLDVDKAAAALADCDAIIYAGGLSPQLEGEEMPVKIEGFRNGDREIIELPKIQTAMLERLGKTGKPVVLVNFSGSCVSLTREEGMTDAILQAWYPGQAGGEAVADVLFGDYNPSGRLPLTFFRSTADLPDIEDYNIEEGGRTYRYFKGDPLYHFGFGLSYTEFEYGKAKARKEGGNYVLTIPVTNKGDRAGDEIVQVYVSYPKDTFGPSRALRAYRRVSIQPGQTEKVEITLAPEQFEWFDYETSRMKPLQGEYIVSYGPSSDPACLKSITVNR